MYKFFVEGQAIGEEEVTITGEDVNHIRNVLRMQPKEQVYISDGGRREYLCEISGFTQTAVTLRILDVYGSNRELPAQITLFQALPKGDKMETIIQKAVELGVHEIVPMATKRTIVKWDDKKTQKKTERWNAIAQAAAKQSKRNRIPVVLPPMSYEKALELAAHMEGAIIPYENAQGMSKARETVQNLISKKTIGILIGPEGGFSPEEIELAVSQRVVPITLGHRILRTETAGMTILSILMFALEEDESLEEVEQKEKEV